MKYPGRLLILSELAVVLCFLPAGAPALAAEPARPTPGQASTGQFIPAGDTRFRYEGRIDFSHPAGPVVVWAGSRLSLDFEGAQLALRFDGATGQNFFNAQVDDANEILAVHEGGARRIELPVTPGPGRHRLVLFKRTEASAGHVRFLGVELAAGAQALAPAAAGYKLRMEFFGDSIMAGACNEDGATDQWTDRRTHNHALSYTTLTAAAFNADYRCLAVSGMGVATGWAEMKAGQVWDRLYPVADAPRADLKAWQPDAAFVNLGENDDSFTHAHGQPFPAGYTADYVALVKAIRAAYPQTQLVLLRGGMYGGAKSAPLREAWEASVKEAEAGDAAVSHFVFTHWSSNHPRVSDDRALADELVAWLKNQPFMRRFL
jgi:lysophospholipase L1-like esterase